MLLFCEDAFRKQEKALSGSLLHSSSEVTAVAVCRKRCHNRVTYSVMFLFRGHIILNLFALFLCLCKIENNSHFLGAKSKKGYCLG